LQLGKTFCARNRKQWRAWLAKHHKTAPGIWLVYYKKDSGKPRVPYSDAVEEALCYGWITAAPHRPEVFRQRLRYFLKMTAQNKRFGMVQ
jgi:uncharacterized protein YdeI (YjbR/CyaY-like superfamily)